GDRAVQDDRRPVPVLEESPLAAWYAGTVVGDHEHDRGGQQVVRLQVHEQLVDDSVPDVDPSIVVPAGAQGVRLPLPSLSEESRIKVFTTKSQVRNSSASST